MKTGRELRDAMHRIDIEYTNVGDNGDSEWWMRAECDCGAMLLAERPVGNSSRDTLNLLDVVDAALTHRHECPHAQPTD